MVQFNTYVGSSAGTLIISICAVPFLIWKRNSQPLKSKGAAPYIAVISTFLFHVLQLLIRMGLWNYQSYPIATQILCYYGHVVSIPVYLVLYSLMVLHLLRYIMLVNINKRKEQLYYASKSKVGNVTRFFYTIRTMTSNWTFFIVSISVFVLWNIGFMIYVFTHGFQCPYRSGMLVLDLFIAYNVFVYFIMVWFIVATLLDLIFNYKTILAGKWKNHLLDEDPFLFRIEALMLWLCYIYYIVIFIIVVIAPRLYLDPFINDAENWFILFILCWHPIGWAIWNDLVKHFRKKSSKEEEKTDLEEIFAKPELFKLFKEYAQSEWSLENVFIYKDIQEYINADEKSRPNVAQRIFDTYLRVGSDLEINISREPCNIIESHLKNGTANDDNLFHSVLVVVNTNLTDTFRRFVKTPAYKTYKKNKELNEILMRKSGLVMIK